jgi:hypothetical protein
MKSKYSTNHNQLQLIDEIKKRMKDNIKSQYSQKKPTLHQKKPTLHQKKPTLHQKKPTLHQKKPTLHQKKPTLHQKKPTLHQKKPTLHQKKPTLHQKKPTLQVKITNINNNINNNNYNNKNIKINRNNVPIKLKKNCYTKGISMYELNKNKVVKKNLSVIKHQCQQIPNNTVINDNWVKSYGVPPKPERVLAILKSNRSRPSYENAVRHANNPFYNFKNPKYLPISPIPHITKTRPFKHEVYNILPYFSGKNVY